MTAPRLVRPDPPRIVSSAGLFAPQPLTEPRRPQPLTAPRRPQLHLLPEPPHVRTRRLCRLFTALAGVAVCFGLFGVVGLHVLLAQGQGDVQRLSEEVRQQEQQQQRLRLQVAQLESPERIVAEARSRLGMVPPSTVVSLAPASLADPPATTIPAAAPPSTSEAAPADAEAGTGAAAAHEAETAEPAGTTTPTSASRP